MVRERKCILCHIVYSSKKEMDEHMRSMLHHRELENLRGRDSSHKCRACRVTVVGLSAYAKHISSQLHKDQTDAYDRAQEGNEEAEEEYFDQELIQLINQKKEQSRPDEESNISQEPETDDRRLRRKREEQGPHGDHSGFDQAGWHHHGMPHHDWQWENERFLNLRKGNFPHATRNPNSSRYPSSPKGRASWHLNNCVNPAKRHHMLGNPGAAWHANTGSSMTWHHPGTGRNRNWNPESTTGFSTWHPGNSGGNWKSAPHGSNGWNDGFPPGRNRFDDMSLGWNTKRGRPINYNPMRYPWEQQNQSGAQAPYGDPAGEQPDASLMDFTSDQLPSDGSFDFSVQERAEPKTTKCSGKGVSPSRDKPHRWSPYPSQKAPDSQPATDDDAPESSEKDPSLLPFQSPQKISKAKSNNLDNFPKLSMNKDEDYPVKNHKSDSISSDTQESAGTADGRDIDQDQNKSSIMPSLKSPLLATPDKKLSIQKRDSANATSNHKNVFHSSPREGRTRLNALNLETDQSNSYISKLRSAACRSGKCIKDTVNISTKEPVESLSEVLRKAKEILQCSQSMRSQHLLKDTKDQSGEATNTDLSESAETATELHMEFLENVSDGELSDFDGSEARSENPGLLDDASTHSIAPHVDIGKKDCRSNGTSAKLSSTSVPIESSSNPVDTSCLESEGSEELLKSDAQDDSECAKNIMVNQDLKESSQPALLPDLSKLGLPVSLQRDLTRHIGPKSKAGAHLPEPNLNIARRIRNVSGHRKSETDKESGLKPTLRQILNASRRNVNWEQVIHHVSKKKQELGKGLPRFGIEMVAPVQNDQEGLDLEDGHDLASFEGFHWEGMAPPGSARKRSLSESSVVVDRTAAVYDFFVNQASGSETEHRRSIPTSQSCRVALGRNSNDETSSGAERKDTVDPSTSSTSEKQPAPLSSGRWRSTQSPIPTSFIKREDSIPSLDKQNTTENQEDEHSLGPNTASSLPTSNIIDLATDSSCTSGTEQNDSQSVRKKRRATADGSSPEITSLEQKSKRRKIKAKKERSQVDQLLTISLREEELSRSLQGLDTNLLQARAALQAAYVEVQQLLVMKQQITMEMSAMRTQRIQILQGLQETLEYPEHSDQPKEGILGERSTKLQDSPATAADSSNSNIFSLFPDTPPYITPHASPCGAVLGTPLRVRTPPAFQIPSQLPSSTPDTSGPIKQERMSPPGGSMDTSQHGSLLLPQGGPLLAQGGVIQNPSSCLVVAASLSSLTKGFPAVSEEPGIDQSRHKSAENQPQQSSQNSRLEGNNSILEGALFGRRTSIFQCPSLSRDASMENKNICPLEQPEQQAESTMASVEDKASKKKKKLRKKKTLRAANVPDNSDTELDICCDPVRKVKSKRLPREGKVTTSTLCEQQEGSTALAMQRNKDENDSDSTVEVVEIADPIFEVLDIDSDCGERKPDSPSKRDASNSTEKRLLEVARSGYDEVSSTSEMGANYRNGVLRSVSEIQMSMSSVRSSKNSSEVSSEPGEEEDPTEGNFEGHQAAVNAIQIFGGLMYTCSADKTVRAYSMVSRKCVAIFEGHTSKVNCLLLTLTTGKKSALFTGSSDHTIRCYNTKTRECTDQFQLEDRVVCLHGRWRILFAGLANGSVVTFAIKSGKKLDTFECHGPRAVSCLATAQEGARRLLLVGSYDCTISVRDARNGLLLRTLEGHSKTVLCMKVVNDLVFSGSSDQSVHAHNIHTGELVRIYKGHNHAVTVVNILGKVMVTASLDKFVRVYELQSHDRLQVYGGHTDMIMCMAIHKSMIYTGCYDGSIQAVRLNLLQNYRCWWHGCSLIFGVVDHLKQHLLTDHTNPNFHTLKCRWKNCDAFFTAKRGSKQDAPGHIERHAEDDSKIDT